jgi:MFS family permease
VLSTLDISLLWLAVSGAAGVIAGWFADRYKHAAVTWSLLCFATSIMGLLSFFSYRRRPSDWVVLCVISALSGLIGMFASWYCASVARRKNRNERLWAVMGFLFALPAFIIVSLLGDQRPPQRPTLPKRPRSRPTARPSAQDDASGGREED